MWFEEFHFKMAAIQEMNDFSNSESPSPLDASIQVSAQSDGILEGMSKMWKVNDWQTDDR